MNKLNKDNHPPFILTIAGSDSCCGAGIQADLKAIHALGGYACTAITAITAQNFSSVTDVMPASPQILRGQLQAVLSELPVKAVKTGMLCNAGIVNITAELMSENYLAPIIDPVLISTSGKHLLDNDGIEALKNNLLPLASVITPNIPEAGFLCNMPLYNEKDIIYAGEKLSDRYQSSILIKGGHASGNTSTDYLFDINGNYKISTPIIKEGSAHGTGCSLSAAIATALGMNSSTLDSVKIAKKYLYSSLKNAFTIANSKRAMLPFTGNECDLKVVQFH